MKNEIEYTEEWIEANADIVDWKDICVNAPMELFSEAFLSKFGCELNFPVIRQYNQNSEEFLRRFAKFKR